MTGDAANPNATESLDRVYVCPKCGSKTRDPRWQMMALVLTEAGEQLAQRLACSSDAAERFAVMPIRYRAQGSKRKGEKQSPSTGRPQDTDQAADKRIAEAWGTGEYKNLEELANALDKRKRDVRLALDRHRKRRH